jgi:hypothetical protein
MNKVAASPQLLALIISSLVVAGCSATPGATQLHNSTTQSDSGSISSLLDTSRAPIKTPALIAVNSNTNALEYWPIHKGLNTNPIRISKPGLFNGFGLVANGRVVSFANQNPAEVLQFNVDTKTQTTLPDPYGIPIDIAIGKDNSLYVANLVRPHANNVVWYPGGSPKPKKLACTDIDYGSNVAVDNEGNLYVGAIVGRINSDVVMLPNGPHGPDSSRCTPLHLGLGPAYMEGVVVDPKTDDLVTLTNPDLCAGGIEGRMTVFPKPYKRATGRSHVVGQSCSTGLRLSADSSTVFVLDQDFAGINLFVLQRSFPDGRPEGSYRGGQSSSVTTIPNTLPN